MNTILSSLIASLIGAAIALTAHLITRKRPTTNHQPTSNQTDPNQTQLPTCKYCHTTIHPNDQGVHIAVDLKNTTYICRPCYQRTTNQELTPTHQNTDITYTCTTCHQPVTHTITTTHTRAWQAHKTNNIDHLHHDLTETQRRQLKTRTCPQHTQPT